MRKIMVLLAAAVVLAACNAGSDKVDCLYDILPYFQDEDKGPAYYAETALAYGFYADTAQWAVLSYDDALAGVITSRTDGSKHSYDLSAGPDEMLAPTLRLGPVTSTHLMLVVCFPDTYSYAYRQVPMTPGIGNISISITFRTWKTTAPYTDAKWIIMGQIPPHTVDCIYTVTPQVEDSPGVVAPCAHAVGYTFLGDTTKWKVGSYDKAVKGILSPVTGTGDLKADTTVKVTGGDGVPLIFDSIVRRRAILLVCDTVLRACAIKQVQTDYNVGELADGMNFLSAFQTDSVYYSQGWKIFNAPEPKPVEPKEE